LRGTRILLILLRHQDPEPETLVVQVPEYLTPGERIKVNTGSGEYISRA